MDQELEAALERLLEARERDRKARLEREKTAAAYNAAVVEFLNLAAAKAGAT